MVGNLFQTDIEEALKTLKSNGIILYPTDTVWGIGCDASSVLALNKLRLLKGREDDKAFIILIDNLNKLSRYVKNVPDMAYDLMELSPTPITIIFDEGINLPKELLPSNGSIAIRCVKDEFCHQLIRKLNKPIVSTSANLSGEKSPSSFSEIKEVIKKGVDFSVQYKRTESGNRPPSSIIKLKNNGEFSIIRK